MSMGPIMRIFLYVGLISLLTILPVSEAQESKLPPCTIDELAAGYDVVPGYETMQDMALQIETFEDLFAYSKAQIEWRVQAWAALPLCAELHPLGLQMSENSDAFVSAILLDIIGVTREDNPYVEILYSGVETLQTRANAIESAIQSGRAAAQPESGRGLQRCTDAQLRGLLDSVIPEFQRISATGFETIEAETAGEILQYLEAMFAWREKLWASLPLCAEAYDLGLFMFNYASDISKISIMDFAEVSRGSNPYQSEFFRGLVRFSEFMDWLEVAGEGYYKLLPCSESTIDLALYDVLKDQQNLAQSPGGAVEDLVTYGEAHIELRERLWSHLPKLPGCAEAFETALLSIQITGDGAAFTSIARIFYDFMEIAQPYQDRVAAAENRLVELDSTLALVWKTETEAIANGLPACLSADIDGMAGSISGFSDLAEQGMAVETEDDLINYIKSQFAWRDELWSALTGCAEVFEIAALMLQSAGDLAIQAAFDLAGVPADANPYSAQISHSLGLVERWRGGEQILEGVTAPEEPSDLTETYYVTANPYANIRSCASTNCEIVATAQNGEGLMVVDDSSDWYELRLEDGRTAFIAGFLMSKTPPGG